MSTNLNDDGTTTVRLEYPREGQGGKLIESVTVKARASVADLEQMDSAKGDVAKTVNFIASMCNVRPSFVRGLDTQDYLAISEVVQPFLQKRQATGETSSEM